MNKIIKHDDSNLIWFSFENLNLEELDNTIISNFDITDIPVERIGTCYFTGKPKLSPIYFELKNYSVTFFEDHLSKTGYSCICLNKNRKIYKSKAGYINGKPEFTEY